MSASWTKLCLTSFGFHWASWMDQKTFLLKNFKKHRFISSLNVWVSCCECDVHFSRYFLNIRIAVSNLTNSWMLLCDECTNLTVAKCSIFNTICSYCQWLKWDETEFRGPQNNLLDPKLAGTLVFGCQNSSLFQGLESWDSIGDRSLLSHYWCVLKFMCLFLPSITASFFYLHSCSAVIIKFRDSYRAPNLVTKAPKLVESTNSSWAHPVLHFNHWLLLYLLTTPPTGCLTLRYGRNLFHCWRYIRHCVVCCVIVPTFNVILIISYFSTYFRKLAIFLQLTVGRNHSILACRL